MASLCVVPGKGGAEKNAAFHFRRLIGWQLRAVWGGRGFPNHRNGPTVETVR